MGDRRYTPNSAAAMVVMRDLLRQIEVGRLIVEKMASTDGEEIGLSLTCIMSADEGASMMTGDPLRDPCPSCEATGTVRDGGIVKGAGAARMLDLLCVRCQHAWQIPEPEG